MKTICIALICFFCLSVPCRAEDGFLWPVSGYYNISSGFGNRNSGVHRGIDINSYGGKTSISGADALAAKRGTVYAVYTACRHNYAKTVSCGCGGGYGNYVFLRQEDGGETRYAHLASVSVKTGQTLKRGTPLGSIGSTGMSSGYHLHFEIRDAGQTVQNPMPQNYDGRHTFVGNSAPQSAAVQYLYEEKMFAAKVENGRIMLSDIPEADRIYVAQFGKERLLMLSVFDGTEIHLTPGAEKIRAFAWDGMRPVCDSISVWA